MQTPRIGRRQLVLGALSATALTATSSRLSAQTWPERSITFICPWPAGGTADQSMRALCSVAARVLGQSSGGKQGGCLGHDRRHGFGFCQA